MTQITESEKAPRGRSPSYPGIALGTAIDRARSAYERLRQHKVPVKSFTDVWGYKSPTTGPATVTFAALKKFGLLEDEGNGDQRVAQLTDLAVAILMKSDPLPAIQVAALTPPIHAEMWNLYGADVPPAEALQYEFVVQRGFTPNGFVDFLREYQDTIAFANLGSSVTVEDDQRPDPEERHDDPEERNAGEQRRSQGRRKRNDPGADVLTYAVPTGRGDITVEGKFPLTESEWEQFMVVLNAMKPGLVESDEMALGRNIAESVGFDPDDDNE